MVRLPRRAGPALDVRLGSAQRRPVGPANDVPRGEGEREASRPVPRTGTHRLSETRTAVPFAIAPGTHLWVAACMGIGGGFFAAAAFKSLGVLLASFEHRALEALFHP